jgi:hypothetical protein
MTLTLKTTVAAVAFAIGFSSAAVGQTGMLRVDVPFTFHACNKSFPAGTYYMETNQASRHLAITTIEPVKACYTPMLVDYGSSSAKGTRVTFRQYGDLFFLKGLQYSGSVNRFHLLPAQGESELAKARTHRDLALTARRSR